MKARKARRASWAAAKRRQRARAKARKLEQLRRQFMRTIKVSVDELIYHDVLDAKIEVHDGGLREVTVRFRTLTEGTDGKLRAHAEVLPLHVRVWVGETLVLDGPFRLVRVDVSSALGELTTTEAELLSTGYVELHDPARPA
jgi:hypothetical protein